MFSAKLTVLVLAGYALVGLSPAGAQENVDLDLEIMSAVSYALGLSSDVTTEYAAELAAAQAASSKKFWCAKEGERELPLLDDQISEKVAAKAVEHLLQGEARQYVLDSPGRVSQLIAVSLSSFEMGRTFAMSAADQSAICVTAAVN